MPVFACKFGYYYCFTLCVVNLILAEIALAQSPYEFNKKTDEMILGLGIPLAIVAITIDGSISPLTVDEINALNRMDVNALDRIATYNFSEKSSDWSDILLYTCMATPLTLLASKKIRDDAAIVYGMYGQSLLFGFTLPLVVKGTVQRIRPFIYNPQVPLQEKLTSEAKRSFFSGHTTVAFTSMIFLSSVYSNYYPDSKSKPYIWVGSILMASTVGYLRISAGAHFPSDVIMGALVGSAIGYLIPKVHEADKINLLAAENIHYQQPLFSFQFSF